MAVAACTHGRMACNRLPRLIPAPGTRAKEDAPAPSTILTTLDSPGSRWVPFTLRTPAADHGTISQKLPSGGKMPDTLLVSVDAANGLRSKVISLPIPTGN